MRTFIAITLTPALKRPLLDLLRREVPESRDVRWVTDAQLHLTLKFLGDVADPVLPAVLRAAEDASAQIAPFPISLGGLGVFPAPRNPRVLWVGVEDPQQGCRRWVEAADPLLSELNFKPETRAFTPHITLGRSRSTAGGDVLREALETVSAPRSPEMSVAEVTVYESILAPRGARYKPLARMPLGSRTP